MRQRTGYSTKIIGPAAAGTTVVLPPPVSPLTRMVGQVTVLYTGTDAGPLFVALAWVNGSNGGTLADAAIAPRNGSTPRRWFDGRLDHVLNAGESLVLKLDTPFANGSIDVRVTYLDQQGF